MTKMIIAGPVVLFLVALSPGVSDAQVLGPRVGDLPAGPTVSPYFNLLRNNSSPTLNYFGLVRPQIQTNANLQILHQQVLQPPATAISGQSGSDDVLVTGHAAVFMNTGGYFLSGGAAQPAIITPGRPVNPTPARLPRPGLR